MAYAVTRTTVTGEVHQASHHNVYVRDPIDDVIAVLTGNKTEPTHLVGSLRVDGVFTANLTKGLQSLTDQADIAWDVTARPNATVTLGGNRTIAAPTNPAEGQYYILNVVQDSTGSRTLTWNAAYTFDAIGGAPTLSTVANAIDKLGFAYEGGEMRCIAVVRGL